MSTCPKCGTQYPTNVRFCTRDGAVLEDDAAPESGQIGKVIAGKYRLDAYLSRGGMGSVFRATHLMLEKPVAYKVSLRRDAETVSVALTPRQLI